jgi:hypothetical protein
MTVTGPQTLHTTPFFTAGGTLPPDAPSYLERDADHQLLDALHSGQLCYLLNARQMGKSSLCVRVMQRLQQQGIHTAFLDLTRFGGANVTAEQWYAGLLTKTGQDLGLRQQFLEFWKQHAHLPAVGRFFGALEQVGLTTLSGPVVVFVDEIDTTRSLNFSTDEFFAALRASFVGRAEEAALSRLSFCLLGSATPSDLIRDVTITPFNVGRRIELRDFTPEEALPLSQGLGANGRELLSRILYWTSGQPYMTQRLCQAVVERGGTSARDVDAVCGELFLSRKARDADDNLANVRNRLLRGYDDVASLLELYGKVLAGRRAVDEESDPRCGILRLSGAVKEEGGLLHVRNRIYSTVFDRRWVETSLPNAEQRRQREAYRKGVLRTLAGSAGVVALVLGLALFAFSQANRANRNALQERRARAEADAALADAEQQRDRAEHTSYIASMNLAQSEYENNNVGHTLDMLEETKTSPYRGFEWGYWNRLCHLELFTLKGHTNSVISVAYSPDGKRIVTGSADKTAKVWDAATGRELLTLKGHADAVYSVIFSPDGKRIVTGSEDHTAKIWDAASGRELLTLKGHSGFVNSVAYSPDGKRIVTGSQDNTAKVWDTTTFQELLTLNGHDNAVTSVAFSADGKRLVTGSMMDHTAILWFSDAADAALAFKQP